MLRPHLEDFRYMWRGKPIRALQQAEVLAPIDIRGPHKERALLLLHGFSSSPAVYRELIPSLPAYDAIVCPILPGHGESISAFTTVKAKQWVSAAETSCESLLQEYQKVDVLGLSLGGLLACHLSQRFELHHLYLLAPALALQFNLSLALITARVLHRLGFKYLRNQAGNLHSQLHSELAYRQTPINAIIEILTLINEFQLVSPQCPTDLFLGRFDEVVNSTQVATYFMNTPHCKIHFLAESAHVLPLDSDIDAIIACIKENFI